MRTRLASLASLTPLLFAACGSVTPVTTPDAADDDPIDAPDPTDAPDPVADAPASPDAPATASIADVLDCGTPAQAGGLARGTDLQRVDLDLAHFPDATCNDGTAAVFYFRPAATAAARDRWVIELQGGGNCNSPDECAARWCSVGTNFGMTQMTSTLAPTGGIVADGLLHRGGALGVANPVGDWNHVFIRYCSSDDWSGTGGAVDVDAAHPLTSAPLHFRVHFDGAHILDDVIAVLRRDGAAPPPYTLAGGSAALPDLDDAQVVVFAGASAGGAGVTSNADRVAAALRAHNNGALAFGALIDSAFKPDLAQLDFSTSVPCTSSGQCSYQQMFAAPAAGALWGARGDDSCTAWHAAHAPATAWQCNDLGHVLRHHVTTPMTIRQGQTDSLISSNMIDAMFTVPGRGLIDLALFAELVRTQLAALPAAASEEPRATAPAIYVPPCDKHDTLENDTAIYGVTVTTAGAPRTMFDIVANAIAGTTPTAAVWNPGDPVDCM